MRPTLVVRDIDTLVCCTPKGDDPLGQIPQGAVAMAGDKIVWVGPSAQAPEADQVIDGRGCIGLPGLVDCHTHIAWAGSRANEFLQRLGGRPYSEILEAGGGILSTVQATRASSEQALTALTHARLLQRRREGVTSIEIKSGYGLSPNHELKQLRAARAAGESAGVRVFTTFLGAHTVPSELRHDPEAYVQQIISQQLPLVAAWADFADVYVDRGAFSCDQGRRILQAAAEHGLGLRVHAEQVTATGAAAMAASLGALSADHLERIDASGAAAMAAAGTIGVLLPGAQLYLRDLPPPVPMLREAGVRLAVATDLNPGSSPVSDLWACATLAVLQMGLTVPEALLGITRYAALALGRPDLGRLSVGATADMLLVAPPPGEPAEPAVLIQYLGKPELRWTVRGGEPKRS